MTREVDRMRADKRVAMVHTIEGYFVELTPGWHWSQQRSFGTDTIKEAWALIRQSEYDPDGYGKDQGV